MATTKEIKTRIRSIKNTEKITKAMELVAASKMRKAVSRTLASRAYAQAAWDILRSLSAKETDLNHPLLDEREITSTLAIVVTSNRGLCGAYNSHAIKSALKVVQSVGPDQSIKFIAIGKRGNEALERIDQTVMASFNDVIDETDLRSVKAIAQMAMDEYTSGNVDRVVVVYTDFVSALTQNAETRQLLPLVAAEVEASIEKLNDENGEGSAASKFRTDYIFEPTPAELIPVLVEKLTTMQIYQMITESVASEHSARMLAMKNASEAAGEMMADLKLQFNKARQAGITQEISEISAGMATVS